MVINSVKGKLNCLAQDRRQISKLVVCSKMGIPRCVIRSCSNNKKINSVVSYHEFPNDLKQRENWIETINANSMFKDEGLPKVQSCARLACVCRDHFEASCYENGRVRLRPGSVPSIFPSITSMISYYDDRLEIK